MARTSHELAGKQPYYDGSAEQKGSTAANTSDQEPYYEVNSETKDSTTSPTRHNDILIQPEPHGPKEVQYKNVGSAAEDDKKKTGDVTVDVEKGGISPAPTQSNSREPSEEPVTRKSKFWRKFRPFFHLIIWLIMTGWWIAGLVLHHPGTAEPKNWVVPFLLWLAITVRIVTFYIPISVVYKPLRSVWKNSVSRGVNMIPEKFRLPLGALGTVGVMLLGTMVTDSVGENNRANRGISIFGLVVLMFGMWATSRNRKAINWHTIIMGMLVQYIIALFVLRTQVGYDIFSFISTLARELLGFAKDGVIFLTDEDVPNLPWFLIGVIPAIIFFVAFVQMFYYWGIIQWFVGKFAVFFFWSMRVSGAEAVVAAATPFIGQGESAMLIKPFVPYLTKAEIHQVMACGFATIAGSVLVAYIGLGLNAQVLVSSCIMSIPASLALSHLRYPEEEETLTSGKIVVPKDDVSESANVLEALAKGAWLGIKIAGMIIATLLVIIALLHLVSGLLTWWGRYLGLTGDYDLTVQLIVGYICYPIAFLLGVPRGPDLLKVGELIGLKIVANEYAAFAQLANEARYTVMSERSKLIATYSLCGFGNIGSLGTQIGVLSQIAPGRTGDVASVAVSALITGILSTLSSAAIAGMLIEDASNYIP
ncbi:hypothetical protein Q7P37_005241 [Cladosporium fusiforme]